MQKISFIELAVEILRDKKVPLSYMELLEIAESMGYDKEYFEKEELKMGSLIEQLYKEVKENPDSSFVKIGSRPTRFILKDVFNEYMTKKETGELNKNTGIKEQILHSYLTYFLFKRSKIYTKTTFYGKSTERKYSRWFHPSMIGIEFLKKPDNVEYINDLNSFIKIYSFEITNNLNYNTVREIYFQAISTSSWANESYLVTNDISRDDDIMNELRRLSSMFGTGVIEINLDNPDHTNILFQAKHKSELDLGVIERLTGQNSVFMSLINDIKNKYSTEGINGSWFNNVYNTDDLSKML